ncbi:MAG: DUF839 domain-containing protein [Vicinamibacterales bacterium]
MFEPLTSSAGPLPIGGPEEAMPITLAGAKWLQRTVADRATQNSLVPNSNSGNWDMITSNETGPNAGRYLFMPFESGLGGVQRVDRADPNYNTRTVTIVAPGTQGFVAGDASRWAPWGGYLTAEESWGTGSTKGRLFEVTNPLTAGPDGGTFVWRHIIPRVSHEGLAFDSNRNLYFVDELNGGSIYKYVPVNPNATTGDEYFAAGQTFALRVGAGGQFEGNNGPAITGNAAWIAITDVNGGPLAGVSTVLPDLTIDGRASADDNDVLATGYNRPEDLEIQTLSNGRQYLYFTTTDSDVNATGTDGTSRVYWLSISSLEVQLFASPQTTEFTTRLPVGGGLRNADNLAIDAAGNIYIVEDRNGGQDDDIWFARDLNKDGDLFDAGEGLARFASNGTQGSEFTGLYFDPTNPNRAFVNIQHPSSGVDRLIEIAAALGWN